MADAVRVEGFDAARKALKAMERVDERKEMTGALKEGAELVPPVARPLLRSRTGKMAASYRAGTAGNTAFIRSRHPGAGVQEHGGVIRPKGTPITIRPQKAVTRALASKEDAIVEKVRRALDVIAVRGGWR